MIIAVGFDQYGISFEPRALRRVNLIVLAAGFRLVEMHKGLSATAIQISPFAGSIPTPVSTRLNEGDFWAFPAVQFRGDSLRSGRCFLRQILDVGPRRSRGSYCLTVAPRVRKTMIRFPRASAISWPVFRKRFKSSRSNLLWITNSRTSPAFLSKRLRDRLAHVATRFAFPSAADGIGAGTGIDRCNVRSETGPGWRYATVRHVNLAARIHVAVFRNWMAAWLVCIGHCGGRRDASTRLPCCRK